MIERFLAEAKTFFLAPSKGEVLSALRIVVGLMMLVKGLFLFPRIDGLYGQYGYLQAPLMEAIGGGNLASWSISAGISPEAYSIGLHVFFLVHLFSAFCFMIGFHTRAANIVLWLTQTLLFQLAWVSGYGIDSYSQNLCFLLLWLPAERFWSLDARRCAVRDFSPSWVCTLGLRCIQFYIILTYVDAGVSKAMGADWWTGAAIWRVMHLPEFHHVDFYWVADHPWVPRTLGIATVFVEAFYIVGVWIPKVGRLWALAIVLMHLLIAAFIGLVLFGITLALVNTTVFLLPEWWRRFPRQEIPRGARPLGLVP